MSGTTTGGGDGHPAGTNPDGAITAHHHGSNMRARFSEDEWRALIEGTADDATKTKAQSLLES